MTEASYKVRRMKKDEIKFAIDLARKEGWNPGIHDAECFYAADPNGFLIGSLDGKPISCISAIKYSDTYGFIGLYIVKPKYRGRHYGIGIGAEALKYLEGVDIGLDGVVVMVEEYAKVDFEVAYYNTRYKGKALGREMAVSDPRIVELSKIPFNELLAYDEQLFPASRPEFLKTWISRPQTIALGIIENEHLAGYAVLRKCFVGYKIGPLFANNEKLADSLFRAVSSRVRKGTRIYLDVPGEKENPAATALALHYGMVKDFETVRMYRTSGPSKLKLPLECWFGVTSFELG